MSIFENFLVHAKLDKKQHQVEGVEWMLNQEQYPLNANHIGGICADEMGLGKTIQMLGLIVSNLKRNTLIVLPVTLLNQWENEIKRSFGFEPLIYYGKEKENISLDLIKASPIVITSYGQLINDECLLFHVKWDRVIYDEAHHLKNKNTKIHIVQSKLIRKYTWLVTGTPIQNKLTDIKNLFRLIGLQDIHKNHDIYIHEYVLKRTKKECYIKLPDVNTTNIYVPFEKDIESQEENEKNISKELHSQLPFVHIENKNYTISQYLLNLERLPLMIQCRQMCVFPKLLQTKLEKTKMECLLDDDYSAFEDAVVSSSKLNKLCLDLRANNNGKSKLIFCSFKQEIDYLLKEVKCMGFKANKIDGRTTNSERKKILEENYDILILQVYSCSEGINLQNYSEVYFTSPNWNPAIEDQAVARCHRMGQKNEVKVYRYLMENFDEDNKELTLDNYIEKTQLLKREIYI